MHKKLHVLLQPGGHIELNENPWSAVTHEIQEETGYELDQLTLLQPQDRMQTISEAILHPYPVIINTHNFDPEGSHKHTDMSYAFVANSAPLSLPASGESTDIRWVSAEELTQLDASLIYDNVREIGGFVLTTVFEKWEQVDPQHYQ